MRAVFDRPESLTDEPFPYCPGCGHGIVHEIVAESLDEMGLADRCILVSTIGCTVRCWRNFDVDVCQGAHGRGLAVATALKTAHPDSFVLTYQGDGDLAAIGLSETVHAASRGEPVTVVFANNAVYGATGGQMAPTTLMGQPASTCSLGRSPEHGGYPIKVCELLSALPAPAYIARGSVDRAANRQKAKTLVKKAFAAQIEDGVFSLVEILSPCPVNLRLSPPDALRWVRDRMIPYYPLGEFKLPLEGRL